MSSKMMNVSDGNKTRMDQDTNCAQLVTIHTIHGHNVTQILTVYFGTPCAQSRLWETFLNKVNAQ